MSQSAASLVEERVQQLQEIGKRRNALLREMYHLVQKRDNLGSVLALEDEGDGEDENLRLFLGRFDLEKHPDTGRIDNLQEEEVALPVTPPAYSPVIRHETVQHGPDNAALESEGTPSPTDRTALDELLARLPEPQQQHDEEMEVDETTSNGPSQQPDAPREEASRTVSREPSSVRDVKTSGQPSGSRNGSPGVQPAATKRESPLVDTSLESPAPQSVDHSSTVSNTEVSATRDPSSARASPPRPQRSPSVPQPGTIEDAAVKAEPLDDEPMEVAESSPAAPRTQLPQASRSPRSISRQRGEDHAMDDPATSQPTSPTRGNHDQHRVIDYSIPRPFEDQSLDFTFDGNPTDGLVDVDVTPYEPFGAEPPYPLPPLSLLPLEFSRRGKAPSKRERKRDKEKGEAKKDEWTPMSLSKWAAVLRANPVHKKLPRATKCLSTRDWSVGMTEVRLIRTFERIELLKDAGRWSFRQIKKQRGVGGLTKTHWDYLMDEMKWMRTDFREERRWKLSIAYALAHAVLEWHDAGNLEERVRRGICVLWKPPSHEDVEMAEASEVDGPFRDSQEGDDTGADSRETGTPMNDYGSDEESEDEQDKEQQDVIDALEPGVALQDALDQLEEHAQASQSQPNSQEGVTLKPKMEEIEDASALGDSSQPQDANAMDVDGPKAKADEETKAKEPKDAKPAAAEPDAHPALKSTSKNPVLGKPSADGEGAHSKPKSKSSQYAPLRDHIVYSGLDKLFLDLDDLDIVKGMSDLNTDDFSPTAPPPPASLSDIFPDLQPYGMLDVAPPPPTGQKKSDRRGDKDDPNKRADDATYSKLVPLSKFMQVKPTLVGTLKPASNWKDGAWKRIEETPVFADVDVPPARPIEENLCALFEGGKPSGSGSHLPLAPMIPKDQRKQPANLVWTPADDAILRQMVEKYPGNWGLVAEAFNSSRVTIPTDRRTGPDCLERWVALVKGDPRMAEDERGPATPASASPHMSTRKRTASQSIAPPIPIPPVSTNQSMEPRKRVRHNLMHDTLRKAAKRREAVQKANAAPRPKATAVHETHGNVTKMVRYTPAELSRMKADKEARDAQELLLRRRNDELARQHLMREQAQRVQGLPPAQQQQQQQQQAPHTPQIAATNGVARSASGVSQPQMVQPIRSQVGISQQQQQQRIAAALAGANARMSPPQLTAAQAAHFRAMAAAQGQGQVQGQPPGQPGGQVPAQMPQPSAASAALSAAAPALSAAHLSPSFAARTTSSSPGLPQQSPPLPAAVSPANVPAARPPSVPGQPLQSVQMNPILHAQNMAQYYLQMQQRGLTPEQLQAMVAQAQQQQRQQQQQQQQAHQYAAHAQQQQQQQQPQQGQGQQGGGYPHS